MSRLRILVLAPDGNPDSISTSLVGYAHAEALARCHSVTLVVRHGNEEAVRTTGAPFQTIVGIAVPGFDQLYAWSLRRIFRYDYGSHALTAFNYPFAIAFEWYAWRHLREAIANGDFDIALRILPVTSVLPSAFAFFLRRGPIPFVVGPINGGLPWPVGFAQAQRQREWISGLRPLYRHLPFSPSTYRYAAAIVAGSSQTYAEFREYHEKLFFVPENGISRDQLGVARSESPGVVLRLIFVGRLVPYKACDLALRAATPLLRAGRARLTIVGDGPERGSLEQLARTLGVDHAVSFTGMLAHSETLERMRAADVLVFPSIREFGGGVVFEALAIGVVPVVVAFGGPGDIVDENVGFSVPLTTEQEVVSEMESVLDRLSSDADLLRRMSEQGRHYAAHELTWDAKARTMGDVLAWAAGRGSKPDLRPPPRRVSPPVANA